MTHGYPAIYQSSEFLVARACITLALGLCRENDTTDLVFLLSRSSGLGGFRISVYIGTTYVLDRSEEGHISDLEILHHAPSL